MSEQSVDIYIYVHDNILFMLTYRYQRPTAMYIVVIVIAAIHISIYYHSTTETSNCAIISAYPLTQNVVLVHQSNRQQQQQQQQQQLSTKFRLSTPPQQRWRHAFLSKHQPQKPQSSHQLLFQTRQGVVSSNDNNDTNDITNDIAAKIPVGTTNKSTSSSISSSSSSIEQRQSAQQQRNNQQRPSKMILTKKFDISIALLCGGLAFDAYVEPDNNSSRWERGSSGVNVAFCSVPFTRSLYRGLIEFTLQKITHLPSISENDSTAERIISGDGIDAYVLAAILEGQWKEDIQKIENEPYISPNGMLDITGAAHVSRTSTCWSTITKEKSELSYQKKGIILPYHITAPSTSLLDLFDKDKDKKLGSQAIWPQSPLSTEPPIYLYVQDPSRARLVLTVMDDDRITTSIGGGGSSSNSNTNDANTNGRPVGLTYKKLTELIPQAEWSQTKFIQNMKQRILKEMEQEKSKLLSSSSTSSIEDIIHQKVQESMEFVWEDSIPLIRKPRKQDKGNQRWIGAAAGAAIAGPIGAATGAVLANMYESPISGQIHCRIKYTPLPPPPTPSDQQASIGMNTSITTKSNQRTTYIVKGGTPGVDWGTLYTKYQKKMMQYVKNSKDEEEDRDDDNDDDGVMVSTNDQYNDYQSISSDLEHCFFVSHRKTGATCAVYRSIQYKSIFVSFRGTCAPIDLITDASLIQETWIEGEDENIQILPKVHVGFRSSMNSISRRLKELILAIPAPGDDISQYDMYVTGHSLGGALSTLFTADVGQYGIDAGRGLPQLEQSEPWWKSVVNTFIGNKNDNADSFDMKGPPRPKSLRLYNFGSPRVGNVAFAELFDALVDEGLIDQAYRLVNGDDVVARLPRSVNALVLGNINYEHVGATVLLTDPESDGEKCNTYLWIEGESDDSKCPVRDGEMLISPMAEGTLLNDLVAATREGLALAVKTDNFTKGSNGSNEASKDDFKSRFSTFAGKVSDRVKSISASDIASIVGIDQSFTTRELRIVQSLLQGNALAHHLEDQYYAGMGRASGFIARLNEDVVELPEMNLQNDET